MSVYIIHTYIFLHSKLPFNVKALELSLSGILLDLAKSDNEKNIPLMIFSTHTSTCDWVSNFLEDNGVPIVKFHSSLSSAVSLIIYLCKSINIL